jgi:hypothetical protein
MAPPVVFLVLLHRSPMANEDTLRQQSIIQAINKYSIKTISWNLASQLWPHHITRWHGISRNTASGLPAHLSHKAASGMAKPGSELAHRVVVLVQDPNTVCAKTWLHRFSNFCQALLNSRR